MKIKRIKHITSLILVLMIFALSVTAFAAEQESSPAGTYSIVINNPTEGHRYEAYQIIAGTLSKDGKLLSDIQWGSGLTKAGKAALGDAAAKVESLNDTNIAAFAEEAAHYLVNTEAKSSTFTGNYYTIDGLAAGYYLIKDQDNSICGSDAYTAYILKVINSVEVAPKSSVPQIDKKVKDTNDSTGVTSDWQDSADYDIGDQIPFQLKATLGGNLFGYKTYQIVFHDTLSAGLTYNNDAKVWIDEHDVTANFTVNIDTDGKALTISCDDVKSLGAEDHSVIAVEYTATLNDKAVLGSAGNPNTVNLEFSNNPYESSSTGITPDDKVTIFSYQVVVNKVNEENEPLTGAGFTLYKKNTNGDYIPVGAELIGSTTFTWQGLDDGEYKLVESTTPNGYNTIEDILFAITAEHEMISDDPTLTSLTAGDKFTGTVTTGVLMANVINMPGQNIPETGGIGTTVFYVSGGILVLAAVVLLVVKKRMKDNP